MNTLKKNEFRWVMSCKTYAHHTERWVVCSQIQKNIQCHSLMSTSWSMAEFLRHIYIYECECVCEKICMYLMKVGKSLAFRPFSSSPRWGPKWPRRSRIKPWRWPESAALRKRWTRPNRMMTRTRWTLARCCYCCAWTEFEKKMYESFTYKWWWEIFTLAEPDCWQEAHISEPHFAPEILLLLLLLILLLLLLLLDDMMMMKKMCVVVCYE